MSGRREPQVHEAARLMGQTSYIYEAGCAFAIDGETTLLTGEMAPDEDGTIYEQIEARGIPKLLFEHFEGRLEYHSPWHHGRVLSHLFRGKVDVDEANALLGERGDDDLRLLDNGAIGRRCRPIEGRTHAYHLVPQHGQQGERRRRPRPRPRLRPAPSASPSATRSRTSRSPPRSAASSSSPTAPSATPACAPRSPHWDNVTVTEGSMGDGFYEAVVSTLMERRSLKGELVSSENATVAEQEYLEIMFWLEEAGLPMTGANIARAMQLSPPTVHEMVGRLIDDGYVERNPDKSLAFTESGREHASHIVRRHRMIERFLTDVLGIPWDEVHEEAERIEHAMSPVLEERMRAAIGDATTCPHGHPIVEGVREPGSLLADVEVGADVTVLRFENEAEELLHYLKAAGLDPGLEGKVESSDEERVTIASADGKHEVSRSVAETVSVRADPAPPPRAAIPEQLVLSSDRYGR